MGELSRFWTTTGIGDGAAGGYTQAQFAEFVRQTLMTDTLSEGVLKGIGGELAVTAGSGQVSVASGSGLVYGLFYANDASFNIATTASVGFTRIDRIVMRADFTTTGATAQTIRVKKKDGTPGSPTPPGLDQNPAGLFEIPLATVTVLSGGGITVTDARTFVKTPGTYGYLDDSNIIAAAQLASDSVTTVKILDANVTANKLASSAVIEAKIATGAVTSGKIGANAVVSGKIAADAVTTAAILNGTVTSDKLVSSAVITAKIADGAVTSDKLLSSAVITAKIADEAVTNAKLGPGAVTASKIATTTVTGGLTGNIALTTITADNIVASTITGAKIAATTVNGGLTGNIALTTITSDNLASNSVIEAKIATGAVTVNKIGAGAVTSAKIGQNQVFGGSTGNIASLTITADNIAANAVTNAKIIDDAITSAKIADSAVVTASIASGAISSDKLATSSVTSGKIFPGAVNGSALGDYAIRFGGRQGGDSNSWSTPGTTSYETVSLTYGNNVLMVSGSIQISLSSASSGTANVTFVDYATAGVAFASNPIVVTTSNGSPDYILDISAISTSGATIRATHKAGTSATTTITAWWICVGTTTI